MTNGVPSPDFAANLATVTDARKMTDKINEMFTREASPGADAASPLAGHEKSVEALVAANRAALEGFYAIINQQIQMLQKMLAEATTPQAGSEDRKAGTPGLEQAIEHALSSAREFVQVSAKANFEVADAMKAEISSKTEEIRQIKLARRSDPQRR